jgi:hypothetical protein
MGWFEAPKFPNIVLGDDAFDATNEWLLSLAAMYEEALGRKPTFDELRVLFMIGVSAAGRDASPDLDGREVVSVTAKLKAVGKRQDPKPGDVFAIPAGRGKWVFGRVLTVERDKTCAVEFFDGVHSSPGYHSGVITDGWLVPPENTTQVGNGRWRIVHRDEGFVLSERHRGIRFVDTQGDVTFERDVFGTDLGDVPGDVAYPWRSSGLRGPEPIERDILRALEERGL